MARYEVTGDRVNIRPTPGKDYDPVGQLSLGDVVDVPDHEGWLPILMEEEQEDGSIETSTCWVAKAYLKEAPEDAEPTTPSGIPCWIVMSKKYLGTKEYPGSADNPTIVGWDKLCDKLPASMRADSTPWCAIFVNAMFELCDIPGRVESAAAVDWLKFGVPVSNPKLGDVVVFEWANGGHHVAFVLSVSGGMVHVIGGNQSDAVTMDSYNTKYVMGYRRAA